jgi:TP901 family phage tail tape measure protein
MPEPLGSIYTEFRLRLDRLRNDIDQAQADLRRGNNAMERLHRESMDRMAESTRSLSDGFKTVGTAVTVAGAGIAAGLGLAVKSAANFEKELSNAKAVSGATSEEMAKLKQAALDMGAKTSFSASEAAQAITELAKGGMTTADVLGGGLKAALDLAAAGELSMGEAAEYVIKSMTPFNMKASEAGQIANLLAGAANASATDVKEMGYALSQAAAVASQMGLNLADTTTALALFANKGLVGSDAGTSLKTMLMRLIPSSKEATVAMGELGLITEDSKNKFFDASGNIKSMSEIAGLLKVALQGLTAEQKQMALQTIFGSDAIRAAAFIAEAGAEEFDKMAASIGKISAADVAAEKLNNLQGAIESLKGSVETAMITIGDVFVPILRKLADILVKAVNVFNNLPAPIQKTIAVFAALVAGIALVAGPILLLLGFIPSIVAGFATVSTVVAAVGPVFAALAGPIGIAIVAIAAFIAVGVLLVKNWDSIKAGIIVTWDAIKSATESIWGAIVNFFIKTVPSKLEELVQWFSQLPGKIAQFLQKIATDGPYWIGYAAGAMIKLAIDCVNQIVNFFSQLPGKVVAFLQNLSVQSDNLWNNIKNTMSNLAQNAVTAVVNFFSQLPGKVWSFLSQLPGIITTAGFQMISAARTVGANVVNGLVDALSSLPDRIWGILMSAKNRVLNAARELGNAAREAANRAWQGFKAGLGIHSPSYIEEAMSNIMAASQNTVKNLTRDFGRIGKMTVMPEMSPAFSFAGEGQTSGGQQSSVVNNFYAPLVQPGQLVVRSEQDIDKINRGLYELIQSSARAKGALLGV